MRLREKGKKDGEIISLSWDEAQAALAAGTHEVADGEPIPEDSIAESGTEKPGDDGLDGKTRAELDAIAQERGVDVSGASTKADVIGTLRAAR